ncbi:uncharacterized protein LOC125251934 [Megalobrama amblycephala]|uniref:uncharacterized protein LOC125251934 n=1 Tax=Megalobrama amblycephala TaxID=75352 RepID=UPI00201457F7|nr:uncharacterized protein LOC125251934 [Megalobrama amblycephala]
MIFRCTLFSQMVRKEELNVYLMYFAEPDRDFHQIIQAETVSTHTMILRSVILFSALACASNGDTITPDKTKEFAAEGSNVILSCSYSSAWSLLWYRQYPGSAPEFLVLISDSKKGVQPSDVDQRFTSKIRKENQNHVDLEISSAAVSDSALLYCALYYSHRKHKNTVQKPASAQSEESMVFYSSGEMGPLNLELYTDLSIYSRSFLELHEIQMHDY